MIKSVFQQTLSYQWQTSLTSSHTRKLKTSEMKCLRKAVCVTRFDRLRNGDRNIIGQASCIEPIQRQQIQRFDHLVRMDHNQPPA